MPVGANRLPQTRAGRLDRSRRLLPALLLALLAACAPVIEERDALPQQPSLKIAVGGYCANCGWIEAKRELGPQAGDADLPAVYEYTVRMADGSSSRFREEHSVHWRVGERLMYIAGETKLSRARSADSP